MLDIGCESIWLTSELLKTFEITEIPIDPTHIVISNHWQITTYKVLASLMRHNLANLYHDTGGDSFSFYSGHHNTFSIVLRDDQSIETLYFNMAHEIGHIVLGHVGPDRMLFMKGDSYQEYQADRFAAYILGLDRVMVYE